MTPHFTFAELVQSDLAERHSIPNLPGPHETGNLYLLAEGLEKCRAILGKPMVISSGYRSQRLNALVRGARNSAHQYGLAADFRVPGMEARDVCMVLKDHHEIGFDQLIHEGTWTHIAFPQEHRPPRFKLLTAIFTPGFPTTYQEGIA